MMVGITAKEIKILFLVIIFGIANWFVMAGVRDWFISNFPNVSTVLVGFIVIFILIFLYKFRGALPFKI